MASNFVKRKKFIQQKNLQKKSLYNRRNLKIYRICLLRDPNIRVNVRRRRLDKSKYDLQGRDEQYDHQVLNKLYIKISLKIKQTWDILNVLFMEKRKLILYVLFMEKRKLK